MTALVVLPTEITGSTAVTGALLPVPAATATALDQPATPTARGPVPGRARRTT